jgi:gas vesicle protein
MENYKNVEGASSGGSTGANIGGAIVGTLISGVIGGMFAKEEGKKARELQKELEKLSLAQQKELEIRLQDVQSQLAREELVYKYLAVQNNNEMLNRIKSKRYTSYIVLGIGVTILASVILKLSKK